jgi:hypothetical protein
MKVKVGDLRVADMALAKLAEKDLPVKVAFKLGRIVNAISSEIALLEKHKLELITKYGDVDDNGNRSISQMSPNIMSFMQEWNSLMEEEVDVMFEPLSQDFLSEISYINMSPRDMSGMMIFFKDE